MAKADEIAYPERMATVIGVPLGEVHAHLIGKPFNDPLRSRYFLDLGQLFSILPQPPARILDLGVGTGWTSTFLAQSGYDVVALDISPAMIELAQKRLTQQGAHDFGKLSFMVCDFEKPFDYGAFDVAVIYDALHHSENEDRIIANVFSALRPGGKFITMEPGEGHATAAHSLEAVQRFGVTEKDMDYKRQRGHMIAAGFKSVKHFLRLSEFTAVDLAPDAGRDQAVHLNGFLVNTRDHGSSSIVVAVK